MRATTILRKLPGILGCSLLAIGLATAAHADQSITLRSGNGPAKTAANPSPRDAQVHFHAFGAYGNITPTAADFTAAQTGDSAYINTPYATYVHQLPTDPLAQWIGTSNALAGGSALYAIPFTVTDSVIGAASLDLGYAVDNEVNGIYINGQPINNNILDGDYHGEYYVLRSDIASLLKPDSVNWLYLNVADYGALSGLIYTANISIQGAAPGAPTITPAAGGNTGQVTVQIVGSGFQPDAQITLSGSGSPINATNVNVVSPSVVTGTFNLTGAAPGARTVTVTSPSQKTSSTLPNAFSVLDGGAATTTVQTVTTPSVLGRIEWTYITVTNLGTVDTGPTSVVAALEPWSTYLGAAPTPSDIEPLVFPVEPFQSLLRWDIPNIPPGKSAVIAYAVEQDPTFPVGEVVNTEACTQYQINIIEGYCAGNLQAALLKEDTLCSAFPNIGESCVKPVVQDYAAFGKCMTRQGAKCTSGSVNVRGSIDPNDITGPAGFGTQGWFNPKPPFQYALSFNNKPTATNPAVNVYLTDTFDPEKFDLSTLAITGISAGSVNYAPSILPLVTAPFTHDIDLRPTRPFILRVNAALDPNTHQVSVSLLTLDPNTGLEPTDPTQGFLPPGAGGTVLFTVQPKASFPTGTVLQDSASVVFDTNAPIATPVWTNTVDINPPTSQVTALPATETTASFPVSWIGKDTGSGVGSYTIYASDNGAPFAVWLANTVATSANYPGADGHTYSFYSIATDNAGNVEAAKTAAEATTTIHVTATPIATTVTLTYSPAGPFKAGEKMTLKAKVVPASGSVIPTGTVTFASAYGSETVALDATGTATLSATLNLQPGSYTLTANYNGSSQFQKSQSAPATGVVTAQ